MILSHTSEYALRALLYLTEEAHEGPTRVDDIAAALSVPRNYLSKILHALARAGFLVSSRGPGGGFVVTEAAKASPLMDIIGMFDPLEPQDRCFLGRPQCLDHDPCPAHARWADIKSRIKLFLTETTLEDLAHEGLSSMSQEK